MALSPQVTNLIIILGMMQVSKRIPFDDPTVLNYCRAGYIASNLIIVSIYLYIQSIVNKKKDLTTLKYVEPAPMGSTEEPKLVTTTVKDYDLAQLKQLMRSQMMGIFMMGVMHLYFKYTNPLLIQSIIPLKGAFEANLTKIHLFGQPASGDLKRPFKQPAGFMSGLQSGPAQSDKKAVESAERAGRGGAKEEASAAGTVPRRPPSPPTPEVARRIEESRLRAKAIRQQKEAEHKAATPPRATKSGAEADGFVATTEDNNAGKKRPYASISRADVPASNRDARSPENNKKDGAGKDDQQLRPISRKFTKYVDYNFSAMTDTKGGFLSAEDDPWNKSMSSGGQAKPEEQQKPANMTIDEWERLQLIRKLQRTKAGPFEPGLSALADEKTRKKCRECGSIEIDFVWEETFGCAVCSGCKEKFPEKYSLLTKTECKEDYLLTDPELKDPELLPHLSKPNPHKSHWHDMFLFLRYQVEEYAIGKKWGSAEALDAEFEKREEDKKRRKEAKFKEKLLELKKKTRTEAFRRNNNHPKGGGIGGGSGLGAKATKFGDSLGGNGKHVHEWGRAVENEDGVTIQTCVTCNTEIEVMEF
ncbi:phosphate transport-domain-containing protein [Podospora fimiseda]|uniref:DNA repair protein RAD14 n=1 Tax=Podospora fimiseda TaxID=252190 RepID=A0AAN6YK31_9PEZI|nr:phosphate transport-domain-containing protein [Podospora fimiseda]